MRSGGRSKTVQGLGATRRDTASVDEIFNVTDVESNSDGVKMLCSLTGYSGLTSSLL